MKLEGPRFQIRNIGSRFFFGIFYGFFGYFLWFSGLRLQKTCKNHKDRPNLGIFLGIFYGFLGLDVRNLYASQGWAICLHIS